MTFRCNKLTNIITFTLNCTILKLTNKMSIGIGTDEEHLFLNFGSANSLANTKMNIDATEIASVNKFVC